MMPKLLFRLCLALALVAFAPAAPAASEAPEALVKATVEDVLSVVRQTRDRAQLRRMAEQKILPHFDFKEMTRLAVGAPWRKATPQQQQQLEENFRALLVNTYVNALVSGPSVERSVDVKPLPPGTGGKDVVVRTLVKESGRPPIPVDYRMSNASGSWKVFDVLVEGVSLVTTYRSTFSASANTVGVDGLIKMLQEKNRTLGRS
jgi:phospholipid transport system substrate-binding protein